MTNYMALFQISLGQQIIMPTESRARCENVAAKKTLRQPGTLAESCEMRIGECESDAKGHR